MFDVYRLCDNHDVLMGALTAICDGHRDPRALARATLEFAAGRQESASQAG